MHETSRARVLQAGLVEEEGLSLYEAGEIEAMRTGIGLRIYR